MCIPSFVFGEEIQISIENGQSRKGNVLIAIFDDPKEFPDRKATIRQITPASTQGPTILNFNLPSGEYAVSVFLDENKNNKLDTNILGIPKELFGFSNNPRIITGPPSFYESAIKVNSSNKKINIKLIKLI